MGLPLIWWGSVGISKLVLTMDIIIVKIRTLIFISYVYSSAE